MHRNHDGAGRSLTWCRWLGLTVGVLAGGRAAACVPARAEMAADLVTGSGQHGDVAVIGAVAVGLATARLLQRRGRSVTIYARDLPPEPPRTSRGRSGRPTSVADSLDGPFGVRFERAARLAHRHFQTLAGPDYGVRWIDNYFLSEHPFPTRHARRVATMFIEPPRYLRALLRDFLIASRRVVVGEIADMRRLAALPEPSVANCTGLGARELFGDDTLMPVKSQLVVLRPQRRDAGTGSGADGADPGRSRRVLSGHGDG